MKPGKSTSPRVPERAAIEAGTVEGDDGARPRSPVVSHRDGEGEGAIPSSTDPHETDTAAGDGRSGVARARLALDVDWYGSTMHSRFTALVRWLLVPFFARVKVSGEAEAQIRGAAEQGVPVYVMRTASLLSFLYINFVCLVRELPLARFANSVFSAPWGTFRSFVEYVKTTRARRRTRGPLPDPVASGYLAQLVASGRPALLFMRRRDFPARRRTGDSQEVRALAAVVAAQRRMDRPIMLIPQVMVWSRRPDHRDRTFLDVLLGQRDEPGPLRHLGRFLFLSGRASLVVAEPLDVRRFLEHAGHDRAGRPRRDEVLGRMLRRLMLLRLSRELRVVQGPIVRPRRRLIERILEDPEVRNAIVAEARRRNLESQTLVRRVRRYLHRISADISVNILDFTDFVLQRVWARMYDDVVVDSRELEQFRRLARRGTVVLVPCHRSHVDYLLISDLLYAHDIAVPHIAAGINLSFWPLGALFRRLGAFFVQRTFKDDRINPVLIKRYIAELLREGHSIEFFIEGGRSRTGLLLPPKLGLLSMIADQVATSNSSQETVLVPVAIGYDRVVEVPHYAREAQGNSKTPENLAGVLRAIRVLRERFGTVTVRFLEPIPLRATLAGPEGEYHANRPWDEKKAVLEPLGRRVLTRIARGTPVGAPHLVASALLNHDRRGILEPVLYARVQTLVRVFQVAGLTTALDGPPETVMARIEEAVGYFIGLGCLSEYRDGERRILAIVEDRRLELDYYRNAALTPMAADAILATLLRTTGTDLVETTSLLERFSFLVDLFGETFVFDPDARVETLFSEALQRLVTLGAIEPAVQEAIDRETGPATTLGDGEAGEGDTRVSARPTQPEPVSVVLRHDGAAELEALAGLLRSHLDAVRVALRALGMLRHEQIPEKSFQKRAEAFARAMYMTEEVRHKEATNVFLLRTAWRRLERMGVLRRVGGDTDHAGGPRVSLDRDAWETVKQRLARCLEPGQA